jgi:integrase
MPRKLLYPGNYEPSSGLYAYYLEIPSLGSKRPRKAIRGKTPQVVDQKVRDYLQWMKEAGRDPHTSPTLEQWMDRWLTEIAPKNVRPKTLANYRSLSKHHVVPTMGNVRLDNLTAEHVSEIHQAILNKKLSSTTALTVHRMLSSALSAAVGMDKAKRNPAQLIRAPRRNVPKITPLTVEEATDLLKVFTDAESQQAVLWATYLLTGARRGEILGLQWDRVTDALDLAWQLQRLSPGIEPPADYEYTALGGGLYLTRPKTQAGVRVIPLFDPLRGFIERWRMIAPHNEWDLVFTTAAGKPIDPDEATRAWRAALQAAGIHRRVRLHDTRHTAIDMMSAAGMTDDEIRAVVGHSTVAMTQAYKSPATKAKLAKSLEAFSRMLNQRAADD